MFWWTCQKYFQWGRSKKPRISPNFYYHVKSTGPRDQFLTTGWRETGKEKLMVLDTELEFANRFLCWSRVLELQNSCIMPGKANFSSQLENVSCDCLWRFLWFSMDSLVIIVFIKCSCHWYYNPLDKTLKIIWFYLLGWCQLFFSEEFHIYQSLCYVYLSKTSH